MSDQIRRIFVDSRLRNPDTSKSNADFSVDLPQEVACPSGTQIRIDNLVMSHSWPTIDDRNDKLYIKEIPGGDTTYHRVIELRRGIYNKGTIAAQVQIQLRSGTHISDGQYIVSFVDNNVTFTNSSPTASVIIYSRADVHSKNSIPIFYPFLGGYLESGYDFNAIWQGADEIDPLPTPSRIAVRSWVSCALDYTLHRCRGDVFSHRFTKAQVTLSVLKVSAVSQHGPTRPRGHLKTDTSG